jgi:guanylate kinase
MIGNLYVISAPSGTGKTTLVKALVKALSDITVSISHTTRPKRPAEIEEVNYHFITRDQFELMIEHGDFLEHAVIFNNLYGTSRSWVEQTLARGIDVILEIDWQGAEQIQMLFPESISIFILPPSFAVLSERLNCRNQDNAAVINQRLSDAAETVSHIHEFDYVVVNDDFETALTDLKYIIHAGRLNQARQSMKYDYLISELMQKKTGVSGPI